MTPKSCPHCGSHKMIPDVRILDRTYGHTTDLTAEVVENPLAIVFKGRRQGTLEACLCGECGAAQLFVDNPQEMWETYQARASKGGGPQP
jgi:hypothetical protein